MKNIFKSKKILCLLAVCLLITGGGGAAWAADFTRIYFGDIVGGPAGVKLLNAADGNAGGVVSYDLASTALNTASTYDLDFYYADGPNKSFVDPTDNTSFVVTGLDFTALYRLVNNSGVSTPSISTLTPVATGATGLTAGAVSTVAVGGNTISVAASAAPTTSNGSLLVEAGAGAARKNTATVKVTKLTASAALTGGSDSALNALTGGTGAMFVGSTYGNDFLPAVVGTITLSGMSGARWDRDSVRIAPYSATPAYGASAAANGIVARMQTYAAANRYDTTLPIEFTGTPADDVATHFLVQGTVVATANNRVILRGVTQIVSLRPTADISTGKGPNDDELIVQSDGGALSFSDAPTAVNNGVITVLLANTSPVYGAMNGTIGNHNLFYSDGTPIFPIAANATVNWHGMTVTRSILTSNSVNTAVTFTFTGTPAPDSITAKLHPGVVTTTAGGSSVSYKYFLNAVTVNLNGGGPVVGPPGTPSFTYPEISGTVGTAFGTSVTRVLSFRDVTGTVTIDSVSPATANEGVTVSRVDDNTLKIEGTPTVGGNKNFTVNFSDGSGAHSGTFTVTVPTPTAPALSPSKTAVNAVVGVRLDDSLTISGPSGSAAPTDLSFSQTALDTVEELNGLTLTITGNRVTITGTPTAAHAGQTFRVYGKIGTATPTAATFTVTIAAPGLTISTLSATVGTAVNRNFTVGSANPSGGTVSISSITPSASTATTGTALARVWNGLTIERTDADTITVTGTPLSAIDGSFSIGGTVNNLTATSATFLIDCTPGGIAAGGLFTATSSWTEGRSDYYYDLFIPVTEAFLDYYDTDGSGQVEADEIQSLSAGVTAPNAVYTGARLMEMWNGGSDNGTMHARLIFTPHAGHAADWYVGAALNSLTVTGTNGASHAQTFSVPVNMESLPDATTSGGGGCDAGFGAFALLALTGGALVLRKGK